MEKEKKNLTVLLVKISDKLTLLRNMVAKFETKIPTLAARIRLAQVHLKENNVQQLYIDLSWITKTIFSRRALRQRFEYQTLDLNILKQDLSGYLREEPTNVLAEAIQHWRRKILENVRELRLFFQIISKELSIQEAERSYNTMANLEKRMREILLLPSKESEKKMLSLLTLMANEVSVINNIFIYSINANYRTKAAKQAQQKELLDRWNTVLRMVAALFNEAYRGNEQVKILVIEDRGGVAELSIQA